MRPENRNNENRSRSGKPSAQAMDRLTGRIAGRTGLSVAELRNIFKTDRTQADNVKAWIARLNNK